MEEIRFEFDNRPDSPYLQDELEIFFVLSGRVGVTHAGRNYLLAQEDFTVFNPFEFHELQPQPGSHTVSAFIPLEFLRLSHLGDVRCCSAIQTELSEYHALIRARLAGIFRDYLDSPEQRRLYIVSGIWSLLAILKQQFEAGPNEHAGKNTAQERVRACILYIGMHYQENLSLESVAKANFISPGHLSRKFEETVGIHFSDYLRNLRLYRAANYLRYSERSVVEISELCGFHNVNTLITNFKDVYGQTPSVYRKAHAGDAEPTERIYETDSVYFVNLLNHAFEEGTAQALTKQDQEPVIIRADIREKLGPFATQHNYSMTFGYAKNWFSTGVPDAIRRSVAEIGFKYVFTQGVFDDSMSVYHEASDGTPIYDFTYLDLVLDFIVSVGAKPWLELSRTPEKLLTDAREAYFGGYVQLPADLEKWGALVRAFGEHLAERYGVEQASQWRFSVFPPLYISYGIFTVDEYLEYHRATWTAMRQVLPEAKLISGAFDVGLLHLEGNGAFRAFLVYCKENGCLPDELGFQSFSIDYSQQSKSDVEDRIRRDRGNSFEEPAPPSADPDILRHDIELIENALKEEHLESLPFCFVYWNSTIWDSDLGNDTCYKAAYIAKNVLENAGRTTALNYSHSLLDHGRACDSVFTGKHGAMTETGVPKAAYHAFRLLSRMGDTLLAHGKGYTVTCSADGSGIQILLYHYCHYNMDAHLDKFLPRTEQLTIDRYFGFVDPGTVNVRIYLSGLESGEYKKETWRINRTQGSSYDIWRRIGAPKELTAEQSDYLEKASEPGYHYEVLHVSKEDEILISSVLDAHEIQLISVQCDDS